ncbi:hypothetical protein Tco_0631482, partial [Tanacetum coccineum]
VFSDLLTLEGGKMPRMAVSMGITSLSKNLLQMHEQDEIYKDKNEKSFAILEVQRVHNHFVTDRRRMLFSAHPSKRGTTLAELSLLDSRRVQGFCELARTGKEASPTLKCPQTASPHQAASIAKCSATKQALPNTTDAEVGKPEVAKEVGGRK